MNIISRRWTVALLVCVTLSWFVAERSVQGSYEDQEVLVNRGRRVLLRLVHSGTIPFLKQKGQPEHLSDIVALLWYLNVRAGERGQTISEGMYVIHDPEGAVFDFLFNYQQVYGRYSSHFKEQQGRRHYGIDVPRDQWSLPHGNQHILFGKLENNEYLFIEPEAHGVHTFSDRVMHCADYVSYAFKKNMRPWLLEQESCRHESVPYTVKTWWSDAIKKLEPDPVRIKNYVDAGARHGICKMVAIVELLCQDRVLSDDQSKAVSLFYESVEEYDYVQLRRGREVIFTKQELCEEVV